MSESLEGRVALVTGGANGIGRATVRHFAENGLRVAIFDRDEDQARATRDALVSEGYRVSVVVGDVSSAEDVRQAVQQTLDEFDVDAVDVLINNAGIGVKGRVEDLSPEDWRDVLEVNLTGPFLCTRAVVPGMKDQEWGRIVNVASTAARRIGYTTGVPYTASKSGVVGLTRQAAFELAPFNVLVNSILPGPVATPFTDHVDNKAIRLREKQVPMGRRLKPEEIARGIYYLVSPENTMMTGAELVIDGGVLLGWTDTDTYNEIVGGS